MKSETNSILVIGGGIAGISCALELADQGYEVYLVERKPSIGGRMAQLDKTFPTLDCSICILAPKMVEVARNPRIHLLSYSEIEDVKENDDGFLVTINKKARYVDLSRCTGCGICSTVCPQKHVTDEFNEGLSERSAIYIPFPQAVPRVATIDTQHCLKIIKGTCGACEKRCPANAVKFDDKDEHVEIQAHDIILATGFDIYTGKYLQRYGYGRFRNVVTSLQYERILSASGPTKGAVARPSDGRVPLKIGFVQCAGSRTESCKPYCSKICCMYSTKEAILTREHLPESEILVFYNDLRTLGKGNDDFLKRAKDEYGIQYIQSLIGNIEEDEDQCIYVTYHDRQTDSISTVTLDILVLCPPIVPESGLEKLAELLRIQLDENGFIQTSDSNGLKTSNEHVYACGCAKMPEDISRTVRDAIAIGSTLAHKAILNVRTEDDEEIGSISEQGNPRIGVFACSCGMNIGAVVDVDQVVKYASTLPNVVHAEKCMYACSQENQIAVQKAIKTMKLNRVLIAACSPRSHLQLFQDTCYKAGLNRNLVNLVSIRELDSWVHQKDCQKATEKAKHLVRMGVASISLARPLKQIRSDVIRSAVVIGGGIAGMSAALSLASRGFPVHLVEKTPSLGGNQKDTYLKDLDGTFSHEFVKRLTDAVLSCKNIEILTSTSIAAVDGSVGHFVVKLGRGKLDEGLISGERIIDAGVIIVATGAEILQPFGFYEYGVDDRIVTQLEFEKMLVEENLEGKNIVQILCVGVRESDGRTYCSQICCEVALRDLIELKRSFPSSNAYVLYRDIRINGFCEKHYKEACEMGIRFIRFSEEEPPRIDRVGKLGVKVKDIDGDQEILIHTDLVVLSQPLVQRNDNKLISELLKIPLSEDGFFMEAHPKLRPVDFSVDGIFVAGAAQFPKGISESIRDGLAAASRALEILTKTAIVRDPTIAAVDQDICTGCARCIEACPYNAIEMKIRNQFLLAEVNQLTCKGCGACASTCPSRAISIHNFTSDQILSQIDAALSEPSADEVRGIAFLCHWCAYAGADNAGVSRFQYPPDLLPIRVMCSGRVDPFHILYAFLKGADGVFIGACHPGDCHYIIGNQLMKKKVDNLKRMIEDYHFDSRRLRVEWISASEGRKFAESIQEFVELLRNLGPNPLRTGLITKGIHTIERGVT